MTNISKTDFISAVKKSRVVDSDQLKAVLADVDSEDVVELATRLIKQDLLTRWQAKYLMTGRTRLDLGSYRLLERISRDELGDRFLAIHQQLGRRVDIQVLPADLTKDQARCDAFIQKASDTAKLDHPNLIHVFDIDQEKGRYFLVTEHVGGVAIDQADRSAWTNFDVAKYLRDGIAGLAYAHENKVAHDDLTVNDLILTDEQTLKVKNLAVSPIRQSAGNTQASDFEVMAQIARQWLAEVDPDGLASDGLADLVDQIAVNAKGNPGASVQALEEWIAANHPGETAEGMFDFDAAVVDQGGFDQPLNTAMATGPKRRVHKPVAPTNEDDLEEPKPGYLVRLAKENPVALIATAIVVGLLVVGGSAWGAYSIVSGRTQTAENRNSASDATTSRDIVVPSNDSEQPQPNTGGTTPEEDESTQEPSDPSPPDGDEQPNFADPEAMKQLIENAVPSTQQTSTNNQNKGPAKQAATSANDNAAAADADGQNASANKPANATTTPVSTETPTANTPNKGADPTGNPGKGDPGKPAASNSPPASKPPANNANKGNQPPAGGSPNLAEPFKDFPRACDLPPVDDLKEIKIGNLVISRNILMGAEIHSDPAVCRSKIMFDLERSSEDKQTWMVGVKRRENERPTHLGMFRKTDDGFYFKWLEEAAKNKYSEFLRNCQVNLKLPDQAHWLTLRKPILLEPLKLTEEQLYDSLEQMIPGLPHLDSISIQILPMQIKNVESSLDPGIIEFQHNLPGRILMKRSDRNAFVWIQVNAGFSRTELNAEARLVLLVNGQVQPVKNLGVLAELGAGLKQIELAAIAEAEAAKKQRAPSGQGEQYNKIRAELDKRASLAKSQTEKSIEYAQITPNFLNQPIRLRINAKMGQHTVELAKMDESAK